MCLIASSTFQLQKAFRLYLILTWKPRLKDACLQQLETDQPAFFADQSLAPALQVISYIQTPNGQNHLHDFMALHLYDPDLKNRLENRYAISTVKLLHF